LRNEIHEKTIEQAFYFLNFMSFRVFQGQRIIIVHLPYIEVE